MLDSRFSNDVYRTSTANRVGVPVNPFNYPNVIGLTPEQKYEEQLRGLKGSNLVNPGGFRDGQIVGDPIEGAIQNTLDDVENRISEKAPFIIAAFIGFIGVLMSLYLFAREVT